MILCCVTSSEHAVATWLSSFGVEVGHESEQTMALMSSCFWSLICAGRVVSLSAPLPLVLVHDPGADMSTRMWAGLVCCVRVHHFR